jgi:hypothetical protein
MVIGAEQKMIFGKQARIGFGNSFKLQVFIITLS